MNPDMKPYIIRSISFAKRLMTIGLTAPLFILHACTDDSEGIGEKKNLSLEFSTRAGETATEQIPTMRLFTFHHDPGGSTDQTFRQEVLNLTRTTSTITAQVETGQWNMALISTPNGGSIISPNTSVLMSALPMYRYSPTVTAGRSSNAHEIYLDNRVTPTITSGGSEQMNAQLNRTVAKVELIIDKTTPNFNLSSTTHNVRLHHIPSTISYTGALLPNKTNPDTLATALQAPVTLLNAGNGSYEGVETISFVIPAHRGTDYINYSGTTPVDTTTLKMKITVDLERTGGTRFTKQAEIPYVAKANMILRVYVTVNDGLEFKTEVLPWEGVDMNATVGAGYQNWLYVKKGASGNGFSWSDPLSNINAAITKASSLISLGKTVNGILVAGGTDANMLYSEAFSIPANTKIFGGWAGTPGTELLATATVTDVYASTYRNLKTYKARVATGTGNIVLSGANAILDGFVVSGSGSSSADGLVTISNATAWANAIEIDQQTVNSTYALFMSAGTSTNMLVSRNTKGVSVASGSKLVNATIANNTAASMFSGTLLNSIYWGNSGTATTAGTINYCAFQGTVPTGTNYPLSATNDTWFTTSNVIPGPHFDLGTTTGLARYEAGTSKPNRAPMLRRGNKSAFDNNLPISIADQYKKDINGDIRYHTAIDGSTQVVDIGCYEASTLTGFQLMWATDKVYVSSKYGYSSQLPLLIPANEDPDINIGISWTITVQGGSLTQCTFDGTVDNGVVTGLNSGVGTGVMVGMVQFTPTVEYTTNSERQLGAIVISSNLGNYLPDASVQVWQTKGVRSEWKTGYVGSFHRNNERGARFIHAYNTGEWTARIISGLDWIKIDENDKDYGVNITDSGEGTTPSGGYYKEVEEQWGGVITGRTGYIKFRVGMKSKNTTGKPRYGLIVITRSGGVSYFFVRQGEDNDYLYRMEDNGGQKPTAGARKAESVVKFSTFNITTSQTPSSTGNALTVNSGEFTKYPSQIGCYFKWNSLIGFFYGTTTSASSGTTGSSWSDTREVCPDGYRHPTYLEYCNSIYWNVTDATNVSPTGQYVTLNREWGAYADGYYDQLVSSPLTSTGTVTLAVGSGVNRADKGVLMVSHYNYASIFFPAAATMTNTGSLSNSNYAMYPTTYSSGTNTHWFNDHIGMSCTSISSAAAPVRCIKK